MVPRVRVVVVASATPSWRTSRPASVTSPCGRRDQAGVAHQAAGRALARRDLVAARGGGDVAVRSLAAADDETVARRQQRLALRRADLAGVADFLAGQQHIAAAARGAAGRGRGQPRAGLNLDVA
ncbi:hypothetical protein X973_15140, partial [Piscirickettsia salmonis]